MIRLLHSSDVEASRAFFKRPAAVTASDVGRGWLIFDFAEGDLGVHDVSFYCDDLDGTVKDLAHREPRLRARHPSQSITMQRHTKAPRKKVAAKKKAVKAKKKSRG